MKIFKSFIPALIIAALPLTSAFGISVTVGGEPLEVTTPPVMENGTTLVPMRSIFEAFGMTLTWDEATKTATAKDDETEIKLTLGSTTAYVDGEATTLSVPAKSINGSTMVPVRFITEAIGNSIEWNAEDQAVNVYEYDLSQLSPEDQKYLRTQAIYTNKITNIQAKNTNPDDLNATLGALKSMIALTDKTVAELEGMKLKDADLEKERVEGITILKALSSSSNKVVKGIETKDEAMMTEGLSELEKLNM